MLNYLFVLLCSVASLWACIEFFRTKDEIPVFIALFTFLTLSRLEQIENNDVVWAEFNYGLNFIFNLEYAYIVSNLILLGTFLLLFTYLLMNKSSKNRSEKEGLFLEYITSQRKTIIYGFVFFFLFSLVMGNSLSMGYGALLKLANSSFIILLFLYVKNANTTFWQKVGYSILMGILAYVTYSPSLRFQFLGWSIPILLYLAKDFNPLKKIVSFLAGGLVILIFFSVAGALRNPENHSKPFSDIYEEGKSRLFNTEDINFIDGFIMLHQVYPEYLDYHYGMDHLGVLLRPVPRSWWPGKPNGGWHQKYADKYNGGESFGTGISTTIYGVFYGEGGELGIIICSIFWGIGLAMLIREINGYNSDLNVILRAMVLAALIPIMRSGDMAGDFAIVGMSYWPIFVFLYRYKKFKASKEVALQLA